MRAPVGNRRSLVQILYSTCSCEQNHLFSWSETNCLLGLSSLCPSLYDERRGALSPPGAGQGGTALSRPSRARPRRCLFTVWSWRPLTCYMHANQKLQICLRPYKLFGHEIFVKFSADLIRWDLHTEVCGSACVAACAPRICIARACCGHFRVFRVSRRLSGGLLSCQRNGYGERSTKHPPRRQGLMAATSVLPC